MLYMTLVLLQLYALYDPWYIFPYDVYPSYVFVHYKHCLKDCVTFFDWFALQFMHYQDGNFRMSWYYR